MPTTWGTRTIPTTTYNLTRLGGAYLLDWNGDQILDWNGEPIITIVPGGNLPITEYTGRLPIGITFLVDDLGNSLTDDDGNLLYASQFNTQYTVRTLI